MENETHPLQDKKGLENAYKMTYKELLTQLNEMGFRTHRREVHRDTGQRDEFKCPIISVVTETWDNKRLASWIMNIYEGKTTRNNTGKGSNP